MNPSRPSPPKIVCLDVLEGPVIEVARALATPDFDIRFAVTGDAAELIDLVSVADFILIGPTDLSADLLQRCGKVQLIQKYGVGLDRVDMEAARRLKIPLAIAAGSNAAPVSELVLALIFAVNRRMIYGDRGTREGLWPRRHMRPTCLQLDGKTVGLLGFGAIGRATARRMAGFDVEVLYHSRSRAAPEVEQALRARYVSFDELLAQSDILSIHVPLTPETHHLIDAQALRSLKPGAIIVNTARGAVIDEAAMVAALASGQLRGAGLDVFETEPANADNPLFKLDNVVVMPHAGGGVFDNVPRVMGHSFNNMRKVLAGEALAAADVIIPPRK